MKYLITTAMLTTLGLAQANAAVTYELTITNGSSMPLSPVAIYVKDGNLASTRIGQAPTQGFIQLCQTGNLATRLEELGDESGVKFKTQTSGLIFPGQSKMVEVVVDKPNKQSIHFETMYGKTKDGCALGSVNGHSLYALKQHVTTEFVARDNAVQTGAFQDVKLPEHTYAYCADAADAIACVRELAGENTGAKKVKFFAPILPSVLSHLEEKFGAEDVQSLLFPNAGAVEFTVKLKH